MKKVRKEDIDYLEALNNRAIKQINEEAEAFVNGFIEKSNISKDRDINLILNEILKKPIATEEEVFYATNIISKNWEKKNKPISILIARIVIGLYSLFVIFCCYLILDKPTFKNDPMQIWVLLVFTVMGLISFILFSNKLSDGYYKKAHKKFLNKLLKNNPSLGGYNAYMNEHIRREFEIIDKMVK
ncbi:hypothetical protein N4T42_02180 [Riemerella anatipestifer]|uniref:hypothetical protein n=1 Tax=Riemerella anatipestifer TaxID=34085 RepID=UPI0021D59D8A|nr:hypothetical protein [Riemerella anatipestifer]MCU7559110.1 hypothetical protein [Riemerella anatipestifer]MDY3317501.1 hypothetical protein [Riemerella anatipestifer]MDY3400682.1 hypothetical protein [Riemerella anatipestifer]